MRVRNPSPYLVITALWLLMFSASSQLMIITPILNDLKTELSIPESLLGTLVTAYAVMLAVMALIMGPISDKVGRRRILLLGTGMMGLALVLHNFAFDYHSMLAVRAIAGAAGGILTGSTVSYVGDYFPYERRGWANSIIVTGMAVGQIAGIPLGILLTKYFGFRGPFNLFAITMLGAFLLTLVAVPQPNVTRIKGKLTVGVALRNYLTIMRDPKLVAAAMVYVLLYLGIALYIVYLAKWLEDTFNATKFQIIVLFICGGIANVLTAPRAGRLSDTIGRKSLIIASSIGLAITTILTTILIYDIWVAYLLFFLSMMLVAARIGPFQALMSEIVPAEKRGAMMSFAVAIGQIGMGLGGMISGPFYDRFGYFSNTALAAAAILLMVYVLWKFVPEPELRSSPQASPPRPEVAANESGK